jgi:excisionase family DNA binding protein
VILRLEVRKGDPGAKSVPIRAYRRPELCFWCLVRTMPAMSELIRTGTAAKILGTSRQHVVDLCTRGSLRCHGTGVHRRLERREVEALIDRGRTRDDRQSLWLHAAVAGRVARNPVGTLEKARANLRTMQAAHRVRSPWLERWERLVEAGPEAVIRALVADTPESVELRQNSPFAGVLTDRERRLALNAFRSIDHADRP